VLVFDDGVDQLFPQPRPVTDEVREQALAYIARVRSEGGTNIALALEKALAAQVADDHPDVILFMTDGQSDSQQALKVARADQHDARVYTIGLGSGVEKPLLSRLAAEKRGRFTFIDSADAIEARVARVFDQVEAPVFLDLSAAAEGGVTLERAYPRTLPDLARGEELVLTGRLHGDGKAKITISGKLGGKRVDRVVALDVPARTVRPWVGRMWAHARVDDLLQEIALAGETDELKGETIDLALAYNLVTPYTSFLAIPEEERTGAARDAVESARDHKKRVQQAHKDAVALSRDDMPPGDPILTVKAPRNARQVTAYFPFGLVKDLAWDEDGEAWKARFLVPKDVPDGRYEARVVITLADGTIQVASAPYRIDSAEPDFVIETIEAPGGVMVRVTTRDAAGLVTVALAADPRQRLELVQVGEAGTEWQGFLALPMGAAELRVVVADTARNEADQTVRVMVQ